MSPGKLVCRFWFEVSLRYAFTYSRTLSTICISLQPSCLTVAEFLVENGYDTLVFVANATGLLDDLDGEGPLTLFGK